MKRLMLLLILISFSYFLHIPHYVELNNLAIIEGIGVSFKNNHYTIYLKEIIPIKDEQGINYEYNYYQEDGKTIKKAFNKIQNKTKKKLYLKEAKFLVTNLKTSEKITHELKIKTKNIHF